MRRKLPTSLRVPPGSSGLPDRVGNYDGFMGKPPYLGNDQPLDEVSDREAARVADRREGLVHIGVQVRAYVLALKAHAATPALEERFQPVYRDGSNVSEPPVSSCSRAACRGGTSSPHCDTAEGVIPSASASFFLVWK